MKNTITFLCLLFSILAIKAQNRTTIAFLPMSYDEASISSNEARIVQETVINGFVSSKRFTVVDREKLEEIEKEKSLQRTEAFMDSDNTVADGLGKGANFLVDGSIIAISNSEIKKNKWTSNISVQIRMLDVSTGEILSTETVNSTFISYSGDVKKVMKSYYSKDEFKRVEEKEERLQDPSPTSSEAFNVALIPLSDNIIKITRSLFPMAAQIISWDKKKKDEFILGAGHASGIQIGQIVDVVKPSTVVIGDKDLQRNEIVGSAWIIRVDDQNFSVATLINNQKDIKKAIKKGEPIGVLIR
ncbi:hypothetical protein ADIWIN_1751 [Winogradskyella psychrotolerans RS-3]|uniref:Curli production assembly/transport component CsgG n=1 Tax=Winogradskyella psychrotolerans RS-3 TaxID=641526 RepID=S7VSW4_9FLAO|nr:CsgG/HfaB family protein [Winogradskyella psychrotolerans]EPR73320.1 hypothetical protein ADIWIN_1751 [Winogradskyella psychrotolerans RS-3]